MDQKVLETQKWLNETYANQSWHTHLTEDGITGSGTCKALCKALQYEIGVTSIDGIIGAGTLAKCPTIDSTITNSNLIKIIQCGFYCKGYECGGITGTYSESTISAVISFRTDAGFPNANGSLPPLFIKALLNTDAFVLIPKGKSYVRNAQQYLNSSYIIKLSNWGLVPCNGVPDRNLMKAIIAALQYEEANHTASGVDGIYGNNTLNKAPTLSQGSSQNAYIKIAQMCLMCMMETNAGLDGIFGSELKSLIKEFQEFYCLSSATSGTVDKITWASLLSSKGYSNRPALACDCSTILNAQQASALYNAGYRYVGRYLTGTVGGTRSKAMTSDEISNIITSGLKIFPIFQTGIPSLSRYSYATGKEDAIEAFAAARNLGIPKNTYIYFAIDYDLMDGQLASTVIPYFQGIREIFNQNTSRYLIGVYGARNICSTLHRKGLASSSFVSDMSTGFSGNLGYPIPKNWAFDQFYEYTFTNSGGDFPLDKVAYSGRGRVFSGITDYPSIPEPIEEITDDIIEDFNIKTLSCFTDIFEQLDVLPNLHSSKQLVFPGITIEVSTGIGKTKSIDSKYASASVEIIDGNWKNASINTAINLFKNFCISTGISIDEDMAFNLTYDFSKRIKNGEVSYGIGLASNNKIKLIYLFKEKILNKENREIGWVYSQIEVTLDSQGRDWNQRCLNGLASMSNSLISSERKDYVLYGYIIGFTIIYVYLSKYLFALMLA